MFNISTENQSFICVTSFFLTGLVINVMVFVQHEWLLHEIAIRKSRIYLALKMDHTACVLQHSRNGQM